MCSIPNLPVWVNFFNTLRELPELWQVKSDVYKDRNKKKLALEKLLLVYKNIEEDATIVSLKKRLNNIKTCYRRELKKVNVSFRSGAGAEDEYVPSLWYFEFLDFLRDQEVQIRGISTMLLEDDSEDSELNESLEPLPKKSKLPSRTESIAERNRLLKEAMGKINSVAQQKDEADKYGESWSASFRRLPEDQKFLAKKAIEEILNLGHCGVLKMNSVNYDFSSSPSSSSLSTSPLTPIPYSHNLLLNSPSPTVPLSTPSPRYDIVQLEANSFPKYINIQELFSDKTFK